MKLTHIDDQNNPSMVDIEDKSITKRYAKAKVSIVFPEQIIELFNADNELTTSKGPVFQTAIIAGTMAAKKTSDIIPFCHPLNLESIKFKVVKESKNQFDIFCNVKLTGKTGVEMEALSGCMGAALTVYDMCKAISHEIKITNCELVNKTGGKRDIQGGIECN